MSTSHSSPVSPHTWLGSEQALARHVGRPVQRFLAVEAAGGILLIIATVVALVWANSPWKESYTDLWSTEVRVEVGELVALEHHGHDEDHGHEGDHAVEYFAAEAGVPAGGDAAAATVPEEGAAEGGGGLSLGSFVNDALMAVFFFVVGLEIKRELVAGELRNRRAALLPAVAAIGGMVVPAAVYLLFTAGGAASGGWGIPMATDIAFAVGVMSLLGSRVPGSLKIFLLSLAIVDDLGAIVVIALFYTAELSTGWLLVACALVGVTAVMKRLRVWYLPSYLVVGVALWYAVFQSGIHATIAGVIMGLMTPARPLLLRETPREALGSMLAADEPSSGEVRWASFHVNESISVAERLTAMLHPFTSYVIIPLFALANAGIVLSSETIRDALGAAPTLGVFFGLLVGKFVGVSAFALGAVKLGLAPLPSGTGPRHVLAVAALSGIGFTVALFITGLSFTDPAITDQAKMGILAASLVASVAGLLLLRSASVPRQSQLPATEAEGAGPEPRPSRPRELSAAR